jgi:hypothetical protein
MDHGKLGRVTMAIQREYYMVSSQIVAVTGVAVRYIFDVLKSLLPGYKNQRGDVAPRLVISNPVFEKNGLEILLVGANDGFKLCFQADDSVGAKVSFERLANRHQIGTITPELTPNDIAKIGLELVLLAGIWLDGDGRSDFEGLGSAVRDWITSKKEPYQPENLPTNEEHELLSFLGRIGNQVRSAAT